MDEKFIETLITAITSGGPQAVISLLVLVVGGLLYDRRRLTQQLAKQDEKIVGIVKRYCEDGMTLTGALNGLKAVLDEIKAKV